MSSSAPRGHVADLDPVRHEDPSTTRSARFVAAISVGVLVGGLVVLGIWALWAPSAEHPDRPSIVFGSYVPTDVFPMLSTGRQRLFVFLVGVGAVLSGLLALGVERLLRSCSPRRTVAVGLLAQAPLAVVGVWALLLDPEFDDRKVLNWDRTTVIVSIVGGGIVALIALAPRSPLLQRSTARLSVRRPRWLVPACHSVVALAAATALVAFAISLVETPDSLKDGGNSAYLVNELLAPAVGSHPVLGYRATYSNLFGYVVLPFVRLGFDGPNVVAAALVLGTVLTLLATYRLLRFVSGRLPAFVGTVLVIVVTAAGKVPVRIPIDGGELLVANDAFSYHQTMPLRFLGVLVMANLALYGLRAPVPRTGALIGFIGTLVVLNNPDFGALALLAAIVSVAFWEPYEGQPSRWAVSWLRRLRYVAAGGLGAVALITVLCVVLAGQLPSLWAMTAGTRTYAGGFIALPFGDLFDFHLVVVGTFLVSALAGTASLLIGAGPPARRANDLALLYFGLVGLGSLAYYANRPVISTLVAAQFFTWGICLVLLSLRIARSCTATRGRIVLAVGTIAAVSLTTFSQVVSPSDLGRELRRLRDGRTDTESVMLGAPEMVPIIDRHSSSGDEVAIVAAWPKTIAEAADVRDIIPFSSMPFVTYSELDALVDALDDHPGAVVYIRRDYPYPEVRARLESVGYVADGSDGDVLILKRRT